MAVTLDNQRLFGDDKPCISTKSKLRSFAEQSSAGLDGVISIDLGSRGRILRQTGTLRAVSAQQLARQIENIEDNLDGKLHTLASDQYGTFTNLRIDSFRIIKHYSDGAGVCADYEIIYTQLL